MNEVPKMISIKDNLGFNDVLSATLTMIKKIKNYEETSDNDEVIKFFATTKNDLVKVYKDILEVLE